ncbi:Myosin-crossreactive antigen [Granulibacter bethesdensis]|uniref:Myosin-crossreactive antigen n=1 Tax=Granulibacter bethesdensis TaxID=364410 RepID=A0AAC9KD29_9PROT|nr:oleate hydratase [Granulibacter bethesdensis]APH55168.1 Myosin-crossreactive antigen [Granulibacter bethesdensis]APH62753.1 Myosin-crossreactive antigen [Granulibacter bethesdensis]
MQYFREAFLQTSAWFFWFPIFAFENWHSLLKMKFYMHRFLGVIRATIDGKDSILPVSAKDVVFA